MTRYSRLYVDLLLKCTNKYASWEPSRPVRLGDYGKIDKHTGNFNVLGNVYDEELASQKSLPPLKTCAPEAEMIIESKRVSSLGFEQSLGFEVAAIAECQLRGRWKIGKDPCAILALVKPVLSIIEKPHRLAPVMSLDQFKDCSVVTEITSCPTFALGMESKKETEFALGFKLGAHPPVDTAAPGIPTGNVGLTAAFSGEWIHHGNISIFRKSAVTTDDEKGQKDYVPLFRLMALSPKYSGVERLVPRGGDTNAVCLPLEDPDEVPEDAMTEALLPWGTLDSDSDGESDDESW